MTGSGRHRIARPWFVITVITSGVIIAATIPVIVKSRNTSSKQACINNLIEIEVGKGKWAKSLRLNKVAVHKTEQQDANQVPEDTARKLAVPQH